MAATFDLSNPNRPIEVGVVLLNSTTEILDVAPIDLLCAFNESDVAMMPDEFVGAAIKKQAMPFNFHWISERGPPEKMQMTSGIKLEPTHSFETAPRLDIVLFGAHRINYTPSDVELAYVRKIYAESSAFLTICGGVEVPRLAGLLEGKTATGPRPFVPVLRQQSPGVNWVEKRWVQDGKLWTSSTLLNGTDMMLAFAKDTWGKKAGDGQMSIVDFAHQLGAWPSRDVDFKDVPWAL